MSWLVVDPSRSPDGFFLSSEGCLKLGAAIWLTEPYRTCFQVPTFPFTLPLISILSSFLTFVIPILIHILDWLQPQPSSSSSYKIPLTVSSQWNPVILQPTDHHQYRQSTSSFEPFLCSMRQSPSSHLCSRHHLSWTPWHGLQNADSPFSQHITEPTPLQTLLNQLILGHQLLTRPRLMAHLPLLFTLSPLRKVALQMVLMS